MTSRTEEACLRAAALGRRAAAQRARAARAAASAEAAEALAAFAPPGGARDVHAAAAAASRAAEAFHLSVAGMAECLQARLRSWVSDPDPHTPRPRLVGVAAGALHAYFHQLAVAAHPRQQRPVAGRRSGKLLSA